MAPFVIWKGTKRFSALQRAEIAEMLLLYPQRLDLTRLSALQRAEIAEIEIDSLTRLARFGSFSALQRAEIAEI